MGRKNIFAKNQIPESWLFKREILLGGFEIRNMFKKSREQASYFEKFKNPCQKSSLGKLWVLVVRESREKSEFEFQKSSLMIQKSKYLISSRMNSKKISQLSLSPNACYVQFKIPSQAELLLSISKGF